MDRRAGRAPTPRVKVAGLIDQKIIAEYADPNRRRDKNAMTTLINSIRRAVPDGLEEIA
jgi:hypothetical protein